MLKTMGIVVVAALAATSSVGPATITATCRRTKSAAKRRQPIVLILRPAVFDCDVLAFDVAGFAQALAECRHKIFADRVGDAAAETRSPASPAAAPAPRAASAAAPPSRLTNSRRLMPGMGLPPRCRRRS